MDESTKLREATTTENEMKDRLMHAEEQLARTPEGGSQRRDAEREVQEAQRALADAQRKKADQKYLTDAYMLAIDEKSREVDELRAQADTAQELADSLRRTFERQGVVPEAAPARGETSSAKAATGPATEAATTATPTEAATGVAPEASSPELVAHESASTSTEPTQSSPVPPAAPEKTTAAPEKTTPKPPSAPTLPDDWGKSPQRILTLINDFRTRVGAAAVASVLGYLAAREPALFHQLLALVARPGEHIWRSVWELVHAWFSYDYDSADYGTRGTITLLREGSRRVWFWGHGARMLTRIGTDGLTERQTTQLLRYMRQYARRKGLDEGEVKTAIETFLGGMADSRGRLDAAIATKNVDDVMAQVAQQTKLVIALQNALKIEGPTRKFRVERLIDDIENTDPASRRGQKKLMSRLEALESSVKTYLERHGLDPTEVRKAALKYVDKMGDSKLNEESARAGVKHSKQKELPEIKREKQLQEKLSADFKKELQIDKFQPASIAEVLAYFGTGPVNPAAPLSADERSLLTMYARDRGLSERAVTTLEGYVRRIGETRDALMESLRTGDDKAIHDAIKKQFDLRNALARRLGADPKYTVSRALFDPWENNPWVKGTSVAIHAFTYGANTAHSVEYTVHGRDFLDDWQLATSAHLGPRVVLYGWADLGDNLGYIPPTTILAFHYATELAALLTRRASHTGQVHRVIHRAEQGYHRLESTVETTYFPACLFWTLKDASTGFGTTDTRHTLKWFADGVVTAYCIPFSYMSFEGGKDQEARTALRVRQLSARLSNVPGVRWLASPTGWLAELPLVRQLSDARPFDTLAADVVSALGIVKSDLYRPYVQELLQHMADIWSGGW